MKIQKEGEWWAHLVYGDIYIAKSLKDCEGVEYFICQKPDGSVVIAFKYSGQSNQIDRWINKL